MKLSTFFRAFIKALAADTDERSLLDGSELIGDYNFRTDRFDCGTDPGGYYEDDL
jgi:hypothetical protein